MIRPAQRKEKERKKEISELRAGTKVLFAGGLIGTIVEVKDATFRVEVADGVVLEIARGAVQRSLQANESPAEPDAR
jgi:preprotein translocase subunit YajC